MYNKHTVESCTAVILAGGESRRMGADKASTLLHGKPLVQHVLEQLQPLFVDVLMSVRELRPEISCRQIIDLSKERGPMVGIAAALEQLETEWIFVIGCDMPFVSKPLIELLASKRQHYDAVLTYTHGRPQPLFGFYAKSSLPLMHRRLEQGNRSMMRLLDTLNCCMLDEQQVKNIDPQLQSLISLDSPEDIQQMELNR
ncbi:MAG: molybdenum cofactor guanylyltransferase [Mariprofundus sp.]|nr:molybdenum cofactor guanylyltransferase [Mariprofundus sp.]